LPAGTPKYISSTTTGISGSEIVFGSAADVLAMAGNAKALGKSYALVAAKVKAVLAVNDVPVVV
jgi:hypothetical protein